MSKKVSLTDMLVPKVPAAEAPRNEETASVEPTVESWPTVTLAAPPERRIVRKSPSTTKALRYDDFERKEARIRPDQYAALTSKQRALNRARGTSGERITENTLIRVAIDLLLASEGTITGSTENEIRQSVGL